MKKKSKFALIVLAAGNSERFSEDDKLLLNYKGNLIIEHTVNQFIKLPYLEQIIIVANTDNFIKIKQLYEQNPLVLVIEVNTRFRHQSVYAGLQKVMSEKVLIHDGARFNVDFSTIQNVVNELPNFDAIVPVIPCTNTIAIKEKEFLHQKLNRRNLIICQTPQGFTTTIIKKAIRQKYNQILTDCASYLDWKTIPIKIVKGHPQNIKLTYPYDLKFLI